MADRGPSRPRHPHLEAFAYRNAPHPTPICHPLYGIIGDASFTLFSLLSMCTIDLLLLDATVLVCAAHCVCFSRLSRVPEQRTPQNRLAFSVVAELDSESSFAASGTPFLL